MRQDTGTSSKFNSSRHAFHLCSCSRSVAGIRQAQPMHSVNLAAEDKPERSWKEGPQGGMGPSLMAQNLGKNMKKVASNESNGVYRLRFHTISDSNVSLVSHYSPTTTIKVPPQIEITSFGERSSSNAHKDISKEKAVGADKAPRLTAPILREILAGNHRF